MAFCASCGRATEGKPDDCPSCGVALVGPADDSDEILGRSIQHRTGRKAEHGYAVGVEGEDLVIEVPSGRHEVSRHAVRLKDDDELLRHDTPLYRLYIALRHIRADADYDEAAVYRVWARASAQIGVSLPRQRAFALAAVEAGDADAIGHADLSATETTWLKMHAHAAAGRTDAALEAAAALPSDAYPDRRDIVLRFLPHLRSGGHLKELRPILESAEDGVLRLLHDCLFDGTAADLLADLAEIDHLAPEGTGLLSGRALDTDTGRLAVRLLEAVDAEDLERQALLAPEAADWVANRGDSSPPEPRLFAALHGRTDVLSPGVLRSAIAKGSLSMLDDWIEQGVVTVDGLEHLAVRAPADRRYLRARLSPARLTDDEVQALTFRFEADRRRLWNNQSVPPPAADEEDDPDAHSDRVVLATIARLRSGDLSAAEELLALDPPHFVNAPRFRRFAESIVARELDEEFLADATTWPVFRTILEKGDIAPDLAALPPDFEAWVRLDRAKEALQSWRWDDAATDALRCQRLARSPRIRDEARSLLACARHQQGDDGGAMATLEEIEAEDQSANQLVNYGVVAVELDPVVASDKLARAAVAASTLDLRAATARRATVLWGSLAASGMEDAPESLIQALRTLAVEPTGRDDHAEFLRWMSVLDTEWLSVRRNTARSPFAGTEEHDYFIQKAQDFDAGLEILGSYLTEPEPAEQLVRERDLMVSEVLAVLPANGARPEAARLGLAILDAGVPVDGPTGERFRSLVVNEYLAWKTQDADVVPDASILVHLVGDLEQPRTLPSDEVSRAGITDSVTHFGRSTGAAIGRATERIELAFRGIEQGLAKVDPDKVNRAKVRQLTSELLDEIGTHLDTLRLVTPWVEDRSLKDGLFELEAALTELRNRIGEVRR